MHYLRQSTASQSVLLGQFVDDTDGTTAETGLTIANTDIRLSANGGNMTSKNSGGGTHDELGYYTITLDATDTATVGRLRVVCKMTGALVVEAKYQVLEEAVYDAFFGASALGYIANAPVNVAQISGDSDAADSLELQYDGTGLTGENFPASQAQVDGIGSGSGGSIPFEAIEDNTGGAIIDSVTFVGTVTSGTYASVASLDGTSHDIDDSVNDIDIVYGFQVGGNRLGTTCQITANVDGNADEIKVKAYNHTGSTWEIIGTIEGSGGTATKTIEPALFSKFTGTGSELGKVYIRFDTDSTTPSSLSVDQCIVLGANLGQSVGYANGAVWVDTVSGVAGTESFVNGTADNPVASIADAITLATAIGIKRFNVAAGSSITLAASAANYEFRGNNWTLAFGGQSIDNTYIMGATISGTFVDSTGILEDCVVNAITGPGITMRDCFFNDETIAANAAGNWFLNNCRSRVAGSASPNFDFGAGIGNVSLNLRAYSGGIELENMGDTGTDTASIEGDGAVTINANCDAGAASIRGAIRITDNSGGNVALTITPDVTGYESGSVWVDEDNGTSLGAVVGVDGTFQNQSSDFDNGQTIADSLGTGTITIHPGNSVTLAAALAGYTINNIQATLNGGSQDCDSTRINGGFVAGTWTRAGTGIMTFVGCSMTNVTSDRCALLGGCGIVGTLTLSEAGLYPIIDAQAAGPTGITTIDFASLGGATVNMERWSGNLTITGMASGDTLNLHCVSGGDIILGGADGTVYISGPTGSVTDNRTGSPTLSNLSSESRFDSIDTSISALNDLSASDVFTAQMTESYAINGAEPTLAQGMYAIHQMLMNFAISGTGVSVKKLDASTEAFNVSLDSATDPTSALRS